MSPQFTEPRPSRQEEDRDLREKIIGLGEKSFRKSYYPELQQKLADLERFRTILNQSNDAIFLIEVGSGLFLDMSTSACSQIGYSEAECQELTAYDIMPDNARDLDGLFAGETESLVMDTTLQKKGGKRTPYEVNMHRVSFSHKAYVVAVARDVTERKRAEEALRKSEERFRQLVDSSPIPMAYYDIDENILYINKKCTITFGYTIADVPKMDDWWHRAYPDPAYRQEVTRKWTRRLEEARAEAREIEPYEATVTCKDGSQRLVEFTGIIMGRLIMVILQDITERKRAEEALKEAKTQAELYLDLMSHDISNINQSAMGYLELALDKLRETGRLEAEDSELLARPAQNLKNSAKLIDNLRKIQLEKSSIHRREQIDIKRLLSEVVKQYSSASGRDVRITFRPACDCKVAANQLLKDVFANLVENSIKHSTGPLSIDISTASTAIGHRHFCRIAVEDTGPGIQDERKASLFDFSSAIRQRLVGKGLGLYLVKTLVEDYEGRVTVEDRVPGDYTKGTRFVILLPVAE